MNVNAYLPDELGRRAKAARLPLSRLLREAVEERLALYGATQQVLDEANAALEREAVQATSDELLEAAREAVQATKGTEG